MDINIYDMYTLIYLEPKGPSIFLRSKQIQNKALSLPSKRGAPFGLPFSQDAIELVQAHSSEDSPQDL